jgi:two-component system, LytTR family, response regulator
VHIRAFIVDDEQLARRSIRRLLREHADVEVAGEYGDGESAVAAIREGRPDLVFLDVQMPEMSGLDVVRTVGIDQMPATIFVTAYDEHALSAFDANAIDYLLKPLNKQRFARALTRARHQIAGQINIGNLRSALASLEHSASRGSVAQLPVAEQGRVILVKVADIVWIGAQGNYAQIHTAGRVHTIRESLNNLELKLDPRYFARIHRSTIVNVEHVKEIQPWFHGHHVVVLDTGDRLRLSRYQRAAAQQLGIL